MKIRVANWHEYFAVEMDDRGAEWALSVEKEGRLAVSVSAERTIVVRPSTEDFPCKLYWGGPHNAGTNWRVRRPGPRLEGFPRFELLAMEVHPDATGFETEALPPDHMLPWPRLRDGNGYDVVTVAIEELRHRLRSAYAAKLAGNRAIGFWEPMPDRLKARLPGGVYAMELKLATAP